MLEFSVAYLSGVVISKAMACRENQSVQKMFHFLSSQQNMYLESKFKPSDLVKTLSMSAIFLSAFIPSLFFLIYFSTSARSQPQNPPQIKLTLFAVGAKQACKPNGFKSECFQKIFYDPDILNFKRNNPSQTKVLALNEQEFPLGPLFGPIDSWAKAARFEQPALGAVVMFFDFGKKYEKLPMSVELLNHSGASIYTYSCTLRNTQSCIYYQRAEDFAPSKRYAWLLKVDKYKWKIRTVIL